eukprot:CAMPEP_0204350252 /NCGR_PEP_ID=MMETSP0469-20131031/30188_1 /ASSEMBLY_ACC=CAM_ASM_000384 /TAXON_ID=2969 /ORGANISM="Oxyrrhis marina" /LENGTH=51 /DNA_ID=CAMNT_0051336575 /DNA_START=10 /DNA_END=161 /DNA_ORIENTATION=-
MELCPARVGLIDFGDASPSLDCTALRIPKNFCAALETPVTAAAIIVSPPST